jgi:hypothetical protein
MILSIIKKKKISYRLFDKIDKRQVSDNLKFWIKSNKDQILINN